MAPQGRGDVDHDGRDMIKLRGPADRYTSHSSSQSGDTEEGGASDRPVAQKLADADGWVTEQFQIYENGHARLLPPAPVRLCALCDPAA